MKFVALTILFAGIYCVSGRGFVVNNIGNLYLSQRSWEFRQIMNITEYKYTTQLLSQCIETLELICKSSENELCKYFIKTARDVNLNANTDLVKLNTLLREKREITLITVGLIAFTTSLVTSLVTSVASYFVYKSALEDVKNESKKHLDMLEKAANASRNAAEIQHLMAKDIDQAFCILRDTYNNNTKDFDENKLFTFVMDTVILAMIKHQNFQTKLNYIHSNEVDKRIFEFVDFVNFTKLIDTVNGQLKPNFLPRIETLGKNNLMRISTRYNGTHIILSIKLPILNENFHELNEFIPVPIQDEDSLFILNNKSMVFYRDGMDIFELPAVARHEFCATQANSTVCNSLIEEYMISPSHCIRNQLLFNSDDTCLFKHIHFKNYFIRISEFKIYAFIVTPIEVVKQCSDSEEVLYLIKSQEIQMKSGCMLYKYHEEEKFPSSKKTETSISMPSNNLNMDIGKISTHQTLVQLPILEKYEIDQLEIITTLEDVQSKIPRAKRRIDQIQFKNPFQGIFEGWDLKDWLIWGLIWFFGAIFAILLGFFIIKKLMVKIFCKRD